MADITHSEYYREIAAIARQVSEEAFEEAFESERDIHDILHETIDAHQWVIYTAYNFDVAKHSSNDLAFRDIYGADVPENFDAVRAFCAMQQDVMEHSDFVNPEDIEVYAESESDGSFRVYVALPDGREASTTARDDSCEDASDFEGTDAFNTARMVAFRRIFGKE